jgi:hypothetical protein
MSLCGFRVQGVPRHFFSLWGYRNLVGTWQMHPVFVLHKVNVGLVGLISKGQNGQCGQHVLPLGTQVNRTHSYSTVYNGIAKNQKTGG